jgi:hypothetical protein
MIEQRANLDRIVQLFAGQRRGHNLAGIGIHAKVQIPPRPSRAGAMFLDQPFARTAQLQAGAVHQQVQGLRIVPNVGVAGLQLWHGQRRRAGLRVVWSGTRSFRPSKLMIEPISPFSLPIGKAEYSAQGQRRQDRQRRIEKVGLRGSCVARPPKPRLPHR